MVTVALRKVSVGFASAVNKIDPKFVPEAGLTVNHDFELVIFQSMLDVTSNVVVLPEAKPTFNVDVETNNVSTLPA